MFNRQFLVTAAAGAVYAVAALQPRAAWADAYPQQPVRAVVINAPGTGTDTTARFIATQLSKTWNTPVVVENKAGAGGTIGTDFVVKRHPMGTTSCSLPAPTTAFRRCMTT